MTYRKIAALLAPLWAGVALAQPVPPVLPPQVWIPPEADLQPIVLDEVNIDVQMRGFIAHTRMELVFKNPNARVLEGEFVFPLGAGQTISGYALEVEGAMREGVVVPKETARVAYEDTVRGQIDPGLAELTRGNVFRTRLYPIPAQGSKRVALSFEQTMDDVGSHWRYLLPLQFRDPVRRFAVKAEAPLAVAAPEVVSDSPDAALHFGKTETVWRAERVQENVAPQRELAFRVPKQAGEVVLLEAPDRLEPAQRAVLARIDTGRPDSLPAPRAPRRVAVYFDASGSARDRDLERERAVLAAWFETLGSVEVELVVFRDVAEASRSFQVREGRAEALLQALANAPLDGASDYGSIDFADTSETDVALVLGDGLDTWGSGRIDFTHAPSRVFVLHAAQRADHTRLADIARRGSGAVLDLTRLDSAQAVAALGSAGWQLLSATSTGACVDIAPLAPQPVEQTVTLTARCTGKAAITLVFGTPEGQQRVERHVVLGESAPVTGALAASVWRAWATARIAQWHSESTPDVAGITRLAVRHGVVTAQTSLLVLDRIEDYVRYVIEPPEPALRAKYQSLLAAQPKPDPVAERGERLSSLAERWRQFRAWHAERHPWLETLLEPAAASEVQRWRDLTVTPTVTRQAQQIGTQSAEAIDKAAKALAARWIEDGAQAERRRVWEREASALMLRLDALRTQRIEIAPESESESGRRTLAREAMPAPAPVIMETPPSISAPPPAPAATASNAETLDRIEISAVPMAEAADAAPEALSAGIRLSGWNPDTPWLKTLRGAKDPYSAYLDLRIEHAGTPSFLLDAADYFREEAKQPALALRVLSNLAEIGDENTALLRVLGYRLMQWDQPALALRPFEEARVQRPEEPQSHRDLALALARLPQAQTLRAVELLWSVASGRWSERFPDVDLIALHELTALVAATPALDLSSLQIPSELLPPVPVNLRVVLTWDADNTDIDLWVIDPTGEAVYYGQPRSRSGGQVSRDFTQGYGPEVFTIARPLPGTYRIQAHYFGDRRQSLTGPVTVQLEFQTGYGTAAPTRQATTRRLETGKERIDVGQFHIGH